MTIFRNSAGSTGTGDRVKPLLKDYSEVIAINTSATGTVDLGLSKGNVHSITITGNVVFTFSDAPSSDMGSLTTILKQNATGGYTVTWPSSVKWHSGTEPVLTTDANSIAVFNFITEDGGTTWYGFLSGNAMA